MRGVNIDDGRIVIHTPYNQELFAKLESITGARYDGVWTAPPSSGLFEILGAHHFDIPPEARLLLAGSDRFMSSRAREADIEVPGLSGQLYPFQKAGVIYGVNAERTIIGDEMGLGKSCQAIATVQALRSYPALVVCPASLKLNWAKEYLSWLPGIGVSIIEGLRGSREPPIMIGGERVPVNDFGADVLIVNYDLLSSDLFKEGGRHIPGPLMGRLFARGLSSIILDESHYIKGKSKRSHACVMLGAGTPVRLALTGTPVVNRPKDLIAQLEFLDRLDDLGGFDHFTRYYCEGRKTRFGYQYEGAAHLGELGDRLRGVGYIRRLKKDVLPSLPDKRHVKVPIELSPSSDYFRAEKDFLAFIREGASKDRELLWSVRHLPEEERRHAIRTHVAWEEYRARQAEALVRLTLLRGLCGRAKIAPALDWIDNFLSCGEKLIVFAIHRPVLRALLGKNKNAARILSDDSARARQENVERFQEDPSCRLIVCAMGTNVTSSPGGVGHTLTAASNVAIVEPGSSPAHHDQAIDRAHRMGQRNSVTAWYLVGSGTIDEGIYDLIERKRGIVSAASDGVDEDIIRQLQTKHTWK